MIVSLFFNASFAKRPIGLEASFGSKGRNWTFSENMPPLLRNHSINASLAATMGNSSNSTVLRNSMIYYMHRCTMEVHNGGAHHCEV
jgi:hypothetical protein